MEKRGTDLFRYMTGIRGRIFLEDLLFPVILILWPLVCADQGVTVMDTTYSLSNFLYLTPESTWFFATFLANRVGSALMALSGSHGFLIMNLLTGLFISLTAAAAYFLLKKFISPYLVFAAEFMAVSFCWCPSSILYNYLTYLLLTMGSLFLLWSVTARGQKEKEKTEDRISTREQIFLVLAGICLGMNVLTRIANLTQCALIFALWAYDAYRKEKLFDTVRRTLSCIGGYLAGFLIPLLILSVPYGFASYFTMIPGILTMTSGSEGYGLAAMLSDTLSAYLSAGKWFLLLLFYGAAGTLCFRFVRSDKIKSIGRILFILGFVVILRFFWGHGMFSLNYQDYWCMFSFAMLVLILALIFDTIAVAGIFTGKLQTHRSDLLLFTSLLSLVQILILPLGSNNYTFPVINCLFLILPVLLLQCAEFWRILREIGEERSRTASACSFPAAALVLFILFCALFQGALFHVNFAFRDGTDGEKRNYRMGSGIMKDMYTTRENGESLAALAAFLNENEKENENTAETDPAKEDTDGNRKAIVFGDAPGLHYLLELEPALSTSWPDLDSYPIKWMKEELEALSEEEEQPLIILRHMETDTSKSMGEKRTELLKYAERMGYDTVYESDTYTVLEKTG